jgi:uncharacterized protein YegJ (DUF2314 family)
MQLLYFKKSTTLTLAGLCFLLASCDSPRKTVRREGEPDIVISSGDDRELNRAKAYAKSHYNKFLEAAYSDDTTMHEFHVKLRFDTDSGKDGQAHNEHIWLSNLHLKHDSLFGYIANEPEFVTNIKYADEVFVDTSILSDWYYIQNNRLVGGWTIKVLLKHSGKEEIEKVEKEMGCKIDFRE